MLEHDVANYLWRHGTPFASGIDHLTAVGDGTRRSDDFVIPPRPGICEREVRLEIAGMVQAWDEGPEHDAYVRSKNEVHAFFASRPDVDHRLLAPPRNRTSYTEQELDAMIGDIVGGGPQAMAAFDAKHPVIRPGSTYDCVKEILDELRPAFPPGSAMSWEIFDAHFGTESVKVKLSRLLGSQPMTELCELLGTEMQNAPYAETKLQFLDRVRRFILNNDGVMPTSHTAADVAPWLKVQYLRHFDGWPELLAALGLPPNRTTNTVSDARTAAELVELADALGKDELTINDLQRPAGQGDRLTKLGRAVYARVQRKIRLGQTSHATARIYVNALLKEALAARTDGGGA